LLPRALPPLREQGLKDRYERHHRCAYSAEALQAAVTLAHKYIADRFLPDKVRACLGLGGHRAPCAYWPPDAQPGGRRGLTGPRLTGTAVMPGQGLQGGWAFVDAGCISHPGARGSRCRGRADTAGLCLPCLLQAIDLIDEAGSRARITAYNARLAAAEAAAASTSGASTSPSATSGGRNSAKAARFEHPKLREYLQVMETKDEAVKDGLYEEAVILHRREMDYRCGAPGQRAAAQGLPVCEGQALREAAVLGRRP
jgi:hypothetical protein